MPRDFRNFAKEQTTTKSDNNDKINEYQNIIDKYKDMSQDDLMKNLFSEANKLKQAGKLDSNSLDQLKSSISPFLNNDQKNMLETLIKMLNE